MPIPQFGGLPPGISMDVLRQLYNTIFANPAPAPPPQYDYLKLLSNLPGGALDMGVPRDWPNTIGGQASPFIDPGFSTDPRTLNAPAPSATPFSPPNLPPNPFNISATATQVSDTGGWSEPTPLPGTYGSNLPPDYMQILADDPAALTATPASGVDVVPPDPNAPFYGTPPPGAPGSPIPFPKPEDVTVPGGEPDVAPATTDPYAGASDPLMGQPNVPTAPGATPDVAPAQPTFPINWASSAAIPPGQPGSNLGGPQGPLYANAPAPPGMSPFQAFMNWLGNIPKDISSLIGAVASSGAYTPGQTDPWSNIGSNVAQSIPGETIPQGVFSGLGSPLSSPGGIGFGGTPGASSNINFQPWSFAGIPGLGTNPAFINAIMAQTGPKAPSVAKPAINFANWPKPLSLGNIIAAGGEASPGSYGTYAGKPGGGKSAV